MSLQYSNSKLDQCLYIVPTKALINQVSQDLRNILPNTEIKTSFIEEEIIENADGDKLESIIDFKNIIYVLTPERDPYPI